MASDAQSIARRSADVIWAEDHASRGLGMSLDEVGPGTARMSMTVTESMVNGLGICHGGFIFALADSTMAFASNSRGGKFVAQHAQVTFLAPAHLGLRLAATAREQHRAERSGLYDVTVRGEDGTAIAEFRGQTRRIPGSFVDV